MKRALVATISLILITNCSPPGAFAAEPIPGQHCVGEGVTVIFSSKKYTCLRVGKRTIWGTGVRKITQTNKPTWQNISSIQYENVAKWAWKNSTLKLSKRASLESGLTIKVGPHTTPNNLDPLVAFANAQSIFPKYPRPQNVTAIYFNYQDTKWAQDLLNKLLAKGAPYDISKEVIHACASPNNCRGASALTNRLTGDGVMLFSVGDTPDPNKKTGEVEAHEYHHLMQDAALFEFPNSQNNFPAWLVEGGATFIEASALNGSDFTNYLVDKRRLTQNIIGNIAVNQKWLENYLSKSDTSDRSFWTSKNDFQFTYSVGYLVTEILVSIADTNSYMNLFVDAGKGLLFSKAFEKNFGISWKNAYPLIAKSIISQSKS